MRYLDFDLRIERTPQGYRAQVIDSPVGQGSVEFGLPFSDLELENLLLKMGGARRAVRSGGASPELEAARRFGGRLFESVFAGDVRGVLRSSMDEAAQQGANLRLRLRLADAANLADLPWEYLYNASADHFLALSAKTPLVRYLDLPQPVRSLAVTPPLRVLVVVANPSDFQPLDVDHEWTKLRGAVDDLEGRGLITLERMEDATLASLRRRLRTGVYHVLHFIGHGEFDERSGEGALIFEDDRGKGVSVRGSDLGTLLHDHDTLRLAILNACDGARASTADPFGGVAQSLVRHGMPAVIAMQFQVSDAAAITFAHEFYGAVADGYPVDAALAESRKAMFADGYGVEWGTPVLYLRTSDGIIFDVAPRAVSHESHSAVVSPPPAISNAGRSAEREQPRRKGRGIAGTVGIFSLALALLLGWWLWPRDPALACRTLADMPVYTGPGAGYATRGTVTQNTGVDALGRSPNGRWIQIRTAGETGWVDALSVGCNGGPERLPVINTQPELDLPVAAAEPAPSNDAAGGAISLLLDLSTPRKLRYAHLEMTVQDARITTEPSEATQRLPPLEPDQAYAYLTLRVVNPLDQTVLIERGVIDLVVNGDSYREQTNWAGYHYWDALSNKTLESIFIVPRESTWADARLRVTQVDREPGEIALDGPATESPYPIALPISGAATVEKIEYKILSAELDLDGDGKRAATGQRFLRIKIRVTNTDPGSYGANIGQSTVRLWIDEIPYASSHFWSDAIYANDFSDGELLFSIPEDATAGELQVGFQNRETARIPLSIEVPAP